MSWISSVTDVLKSAAGAVTSTAQAVGSAVKGAAIATGKAVVSTADTVGDYLASAKEVIGNYYDAWQAGRENGNAFTLEMRQEALKSGPVGSFAYRSALTNAFIKRNPGSIVTIGSIGKAGTTTLTKEGGGYILDFAKKEAGALEGTAAKGIKNIAGFATSVAKKAADSKGFSSIFQGAFGKVLAVGGLITGGVLAVTNTLDFYNWQGPIQTGLRKSFPWLFPAVDNAKKGKKTIEIRKMTPTETAQLQQLFYAQTGQLYSGEELRKLIYKEFGITVIETKPTKGEIAGPLAAGGGVSFSQAVNNATTKLAIKSTPNYMISNQDDLQNSAQNEIAAFLQALPSRMSFNFLFKKSFKDADGVTRKGNFAFMQIKVTTKTGGQSTLAEIPLGTTPAQLVNPGQLNSAVVNANIMAQLAGSSQLATPEQMQSGSTVTDYEAGYQFYRSLGLTDINTPEKYNRRRDDDLKQYNADKARVLDALYRAQNLEQSPDPRDQNSEQARQYRQEYNNRLVQLKSNPFYQQFDVANFNPLKGVERQ